MFKKCSVSCDILCGLSCAFLQPRILNHTITKTQVTPTKTQTRPQNHTTKHKSYHKECHKSDHKSHHKNATQKHKSYQKRSTKATANHTTKNANHTTYQKTQIRPNKYHKVLFFLWFDLCFFCVCVPFLFPREGLQFSTWSIKQAPHSLGPETSGAAHSSGGQPSLPLEPALSSALPDLPVNPTSAQLVFFGSSFSCPRALRSAKLSVNGVLRFCRFVWPHGKQAGDKCKIIRPRASDLPVLTLSLLSQESKKAEGIQVDDSELERFEPLTV